ncbi:GNAT family N-acetyltransferase [Sneathiella sp. HT1-7]|jgi:GNAT superfamily N-acetyltransferase|uniref:GNAT family N-acetyltransferase n=1 Tax=Sneathiella sp. HT1-7 TaxID=2887192 RepID=UPI001D1581B2|nr:GNAT family N-acetyltransferase [Sneathiella sp. HT1-7]MCC3304910.1 GNAT family N-acetyltransferase [Sneathiella sp. HT1-7]
MPIKRPPTPTHTGKWPVTITFLEMTERQNAAPPPPPAIPHAIIRAETPTVSFYRYLYNTVGRDWGWIDRRLVPDAELEEILQAETTEVYVLYIKGVPAGFVELNAAEMPDAVDVAYFGIMPEFIGMRLGPYFLNWALEEAWEKGPERVTVNTCTLDHPKALPMYQRAGFEPIRRREIEIDPIEDI